MHRWLLISAIALVGTTFGQEVKRAAEPTPSPSPSTSVVRGIVLYEDDGKPVRRAPIGLVDIKRYVGEGPPKGYTMTDVEPEGLVLTDDDGRFEIKNLISGSYYPYVDLPNVLNPQSINRFFDRNSTVSFSKLDEYFSKVTVDGLIDVFVRVLVKRGAAVSGRVLYVDGSPAIGVRVRVGRKDTEGLEKDLVFAKEARTDDRGYYRIIELLPSDYVIEVTEPSVHSTTKGAEETFRSTEFVTGSELRTYYPSASNLTDARKISLDWGREADNVDVTVPERRLHRVSGVVVAKDTQKPLTGIRVQFQRIVAEDEGPDYYGSNDENEVWADQLGAWAFKDLPSGKYRLEVSPEKTSYTQEEAPAIEYSRAYKDFEIGQDDLKDIRIELAPGASISGTVSVEGEKDLPSLLQISLTDDKQRINAETQLYKPRGDEQDQSTSKVRNFRIGSMVGGNYRLNIYAGDGFYVKSARLGDKDLTTGPLEIKEAQNFGHLNIVLSKEVGRLTGQVFTTKDKPAKIQPFILIPTNERLQQSPIYLIFGQSGLNGDIDITGAPGEYYLTFPKKSELQNLSGAEWTKALTEHAEKVTLRTGDTTTVKIIMDSP